MACSMPCTGRRRVPHKGKRQKAKGKRQKAKGKRDFVAERNLDVRLLAYGARVIRLVEALPKTLVCNRIGDQLLRSGMAVGANYEEAQGAESRPDFNHKLQIALKELRESNYWLRLLEIA